MNRLQVGTPSDLAPLRERLALLQGGRLIAAAAVLITAELAPGRFNVSSSRVIAITAGYAVVTTTIEVARRALRARAVAVVTGLSLADALLLVSLVLISGGSSSPFLFVCYLQVVAATLLVSYRTSLRVAVLYALVFPLGDAIAKNTGRPSEAIATEAGVVVSFVMFALITAGLSSFNESALRQSRMVSASMADLALGLDTTNDTYDTCHLAAKHLQQALGISHVAVAIEDEGVVRISVADGSNDYRLEVAASDLMESLVHWDSNDWSPRLVHLPDREPDPLTRLLALSPNILAAPITAHRDQLGWIVADFGGTRRTRVPVEVPDTISWVGGHMGAVISNYRLMEISSRLAAQDPLTELPNRRSFMAALNAEIARTARRGSSLAVAFLDIDHFKAVNDQFGHATGDEVLKELADGLRNCIREGDTAARIGGEEFVVLLPDISSSSVAVAVTERLRNRASETVATVRINISAGVAMFPSQARSAEELITAADTAMYEAKRRGRNQTVLSSATTALSVMPRY